MITCCNEQLELPFPRYLVQQLVTVACENGQDYVEEYLIGTFTCRAEACEYAITLRDCNTKWNIDYEVVEEHDNAV